jgi:cytochrome c oxidase subunit II
MRVRRCGRLSCLAPLAIAVSGCYPASTSTQGHQISDLYRLFFVGGVIVAGIVWSTATWAILRYRQRDDHVPKQTHGNTALEIAWTSIPLVTVLVLFWFTFQTINSVQAISPDPGVEVHVQAFRWQWRFDYTGRDVTVVGSAGEDPELVVPVNQPIHVTLESVDVNHAFYVPAFLFKRDAIPGHVNRFDFTVQTPGIYPGECAEFCGVLHTSMRFSVRAVTQAEFDAWLASQPRASPAAVPPASGAPSGSPAPSSSTP